MKALTLAGLSTDPKRLVDLIRGIGEPKVPETIIDTPAVPFDPLETLPVVGGGADNEHDDTDTLFDFARENFPDPGDFPVFGGRDNSGRGGRGEVGGSVDLEGDIIANPAEPFDPLGAFGQPTTASADMRPNLGGSQMRSPTLPTQLPSKATDIDSLLDAVNMVSLGRRPLVRGGLV